MQKSAANTNDPITPRIESERLEFTDIKAAEKRLGPELMAFIRGLLERAGEVTEAGDVNADKS